ncbi:SUMF1/EgtB/PvdO family nonheme iron enzyme [Phytoactinopolyspora limicola]|uniref:SUMF1/EgtB/PvdO family nonheme iron enzyme n=1 Tax=Phytoactinopolyspora limicola TaxID=2715536 RepID=UPI00140882EF
MVLLPGGAFIMGTDRTDGYPADGEGPAREVTLSPFWIDTTTVSNENFSTFADATGWVTVAERLGTSFVFAAYLPANFPPTRAVSDAPWWREVQGADWRHPEGPQSTIADRMDHPAVHLTWRDARAYANWAGKRLPTEAEWEYAARGGLVQQRYPWGDQREPAGEHRMNVWQGTFPTRDTGADGYVGTAPVDAYPPNGYGLYNTTGNVWEWCADWFDPVWHRDGPRVDPTGPPSTGRKVMRGGSHLCHASYCYRYRVDARSSNTPDSSAGNIGFRCVRSADTAN